MANKFDLRLKGFVGGWDFDSDYVQYILDKFPDRGVAVMIDSLGGRTDTALSISAAFRNHGNVSVHYVGMNASAATIAAMGAKHISIDEHAMFLVHKCSYEFFDWSMKNADEFQQLIEDITKAKSDLEKIDGNIASLYASRCKRKSSDLLDLMKEGAWLTAREAKDWGFVDEITSYSEDKAPKISEAVAIAMKADGIPMPNNITVDGAEMSMVDKIVAKISDILKPKSSKDMENPEEKKKDASENAESPDDRVKQLENSIAEKDAAHAEEIKKLKAEIEQMKKSPAEDSAKVIDEKKKNDEPQSNLQNFVKTSKSASELFDALP